MKTRSSCLRKARVLLSILLLVSMGMLFVLTTRAAGKAGTKGTSPAAHSSRIRLNRARLVMKTGRTKQLTLRNAGKEVTWSSSKRSVATVTDQGLVKAKGIGKCDIVAKSKGKTYRCRIIVCRNKKTYKYNRFKNRKKTEKSQERIVVAGSSAIGHWKNAADVFAPYEVINVGIGGSTVKQWLKWYKALIVDYEPDAVVLFPGTRNEITRHHSCEKTTAHVCKLLRQLHKELPDVPIYYMSVYCNYKNRKNWPKEKRCNEKVSKYCEQLENVYYIDVTSVLMNGDAPRPGVISGDGVHMSDRGYALWNEVVVPIVRYALERRSTK